MLVSLYYNNCLSFHSSDFIALL